MLSAASVVKSFSYGTLPGRRIHLVLENKILQWGSRVNRLPAEVTKKTKLLLVGDVFDFSKLGYDFSCDIIGDEVVGMIFDGVGPDRIVPSANVPGGWGRFIRRTVFAGIFHNTVGVTRKYRVMPRVSK